MVDQQCRSGGETGFDFWVDIDGRGFDVVFLSVVLLVGSADTLAAVAVNARKDLRSLPAWTFFSMPSSMIFSRSEILRY